MIYELRIKNNVKFTFMSYAIKVNWKNFSITANSRICKKLRQLNLFQIVFNHSIFIVKNKISFEFFILQKIRKPMRVVRPHRMKWYFTYMEPLRFHFFAFNRLSFKFFGFKNMHF